MSWPAYAGHPGDPDSSVGVMRFSTGWPALRWAMTTKQIRARASKHICAIGLQELGGPQFAGASGGVAPFIANPRGNHTLRFSPDFFASQWRFRTPLIRKLLRFESPDDMTTSAPATCPVSSIFIQATIPSFTAKLVAYTPVIENNKTIPTSSRVRIETITSTPSRRPISPSAGCASGARH